MKRFSALLTLFFVLFLAACGTTEPETAVTNPNNSAPATENSPAPSFTPAQTVAEAAALRNHDYTHGAAEPIVTIIEYGDFQ